MKHFYAILIAIGGIPTLLIILAILGIPLYKIVEKGWPWEDGWDWEEWGLSAVFGVATIIGMIGVLGIFLFMEKVIV